MLTGINLLNKVNELQEQGAKATEIVRACGYEYDGKVHYTQFYTELLTVFPKSIGNSILICVKSMVRML